MLVPWLNSLLMKEVFLSGMQPQKGLVCHWHNHCHPKRVYSNLIFRITWIFHILKANSVTKLSTNKEDGSWENLNYCLSSSKMNVDSAAGRLKGWWLILHDQLGFFVFYVISRAWHCSQSEWVRWPFVEMRQPEKYTVNNTIASAFRWWKL